MLFTTEFIDLIRQSYTMNPGENRDSDKRKKKLDLDQIKIKPEVSMVRGIFYVKSWMTPVREHLHGIIYPHYFKLFKGENGDVEMKYKNCCSDRWLPETVDRNPGSVVVLKVEHLSYFTIKKKKTLFNDYHFGRTFARFSFGLVNLKKQIFDREDTPFRKF